MSDKKIVLQARAHLIDVDDELFSTVAQIAGDELVNQEDLLHVRSVLVTTGGNENQDVFIKDELWAARKTPIHKPSDWDHNRTKIVGHMYNVVAKTLDGEELDIDADEPTTVGGIPYDGDFELIVDEVIYAYLLPEYAEAIREKASKNELFVSMEVWFKSYDYGVWQRDDKLDATAKQHLCKLSEGIEIIKRDENLHMERFLRTSGGDGELEDGRLIGRVLRNMIFGGKGFVGVPANPRSVIEKIGKENDTIETIEEEVGLLQSVTASATSEEVLEVTMSAETVERLEARIQELEEKLEGLTAENVELKASAATEALEKAHAIQSKQLDEVLRAVAMPAEIARIDEILSRGGSADELWAAKLAWMTDTMGSRQTRATEAESKVLAYQTAERFEKVKSLDLYSEKSLDKVKERIGVMSDNEFSDWLEERQEFASQQNKLFEKLAAFESTGADDADGAEGEKKGVQDSEPEGQEDGAAEAAMEALAGAEGEEKIDLEGTEAEHEEDEDDEGLGDLIDLTTRYTSERKENIRKKRKNFGQ